MKNNFTMSTSHLVKGLRSFLLVSILGSSAVSFAQSEFGLPANSREDATKRAQYAKHFVNPDGMNTAILTAGSSLNYLNAGKWESIDNTVTNNTTGKNTQHAWANTTNQFQSFYPATATQGVITEFKEGIVTEGLNKKMLWLDENFNTLSTTTIANTAGTAERNRVAYANVASNIDLEYFQDNDGRKMNYVLRNAAALQNAPATASYLAFAENIILPADAVVSTTTNELGQIISIDVNVKGTHLLRYTLPKHLDSTGKYTESFYLINNNTIITVVEKSWLNSGLSFPVFIDPTVTVYPSAAGDYNTGSIDAQSNKHANTDINAGYREAYGSAAGATARRFFRAWASFDTTSIPNDATIDAVTFGCHIVVNNLYFPDEQQVKVNVIASGTVPNQLEGGALYNAINANTANSIFAINPLPANTVTPLSATLPFSAAAVQGVRSALATDMVSFGFVATGSYSPDFSEFVSLYGSAQPAQTTNGRVYLSVQYTNSMSIGENTKLIGLYPNPAQDQLNITTDATVTAIEVFSLLGQSVAKNVNSNQISVAGLASGMYAVQVTLDNGTVVNQKFMKN
jgi:hypothetical protein